MNDFTVPRLLIEIGGPRDADHAKARPFQVFRERPAIVVLGDPGLGKTILLQHETASEANAEFISARKLLRTANTAELHGKTLFIDGFDEIRVSREDGSAALDRLIARLEALNRPRFRLTCRAQDWYEELDERNLRDASANGRITLLRLVPLSEEDIAAIVQSKGMDGQSFLATATELGVVDILKNPQNLTLFLKVVRDGRELPESRRDLYERATRKLAEERNPEHARSEKSKIPTDVILEAAGYLSAIELCAGTAGWAQSRTRADDDFPCLLDVPGSNSELSAATRTRLFRSESPERCSSQHRTIAEFLAARFIAGRIQKGLPLGRALALMTGFDGGTLSNLRGLYAWLSSFCEASAEVLCARDPLGIVLYGDVSFFATSAKRNLLGELAKLGRVDPWFRSEDWSDRPFGALGSKDLEDEFRKILKDPSAPTSLVSCVLDAITFGEPMPNLCDDLLSSARSGHFAVSCIEAFDAICPTRRSDLRKLLDAVQSGEVPDNNLELRGHLLMTLYPNIVKPDEVGAYLVEAKENFIGTYSMFLGYHLLELTPAATLPALADALLRSPPPAIAPPPNGRQFAVRRFVSWLVLALLEHLGESESSARVYEWLGLLVDEHGYPAVDAEETKKIRSYFESRPELIRGLFSYWLTLRHGDPRYEYFKFWTRLCGSQPPILFGDDLLSHAAEEQDTELARCLFRQAVILGTVMDRDDAPSLEKLFAFVGKHPEFGDILLADESAESCLYQFIPSWRVEDAERKSRAEREKQQKREHHDSEFLPHLQELTSGEAIGPLAYFAKVYFGLFSDIDSALAPSDRLKVVLSDRLTEAVLKGFVEILKSPKIPTASDIGKVQARRKYYPIGYAVLAGLDLIAESIDPAAVSDDVLAVGLCFHLTNVTNTDRKWVRDLARDKPDLAARALVSLWRPSLSNAASDVPGLWELVHNDDMAAICRIVAPPLLNEFPRCHEKALQLLIAATLKADDDVIVLHLARTMLSRRGLLTGERRLLWLAAAFALAPEEFAEKLVRYVKSSETAAARLLVLLASEGNAEFSRRWRRTPTALATLIRIATRSIPVRAEEEDFLNDSNRRIRSLINQLAEYSSDDATDLLNELSQSKYLEPYATVLAHASALQVRKRRDDRFKYPNVSEAVSTLANRAPANIVDLHALVVSHLRDYAAEVRNASSSPYRAYWNESGGKLTNPKPENDARDRLLEWLKIKLSPFGVVAEREGSYVEDNRADIKVIYKDLNLPIEIKRHYHRDLWSAIESQLVVKYARDPAAAGRGIYLTFWFGEGLGRKLPKVPEPLARPNTVRELESCLRTRIPRGHEALIEVVCLDCCPPKKELQKVKPAISRKRKPNKH